jgi:four helix bundle protein
MPTVSVGISQFNGYTKIMLDKTPNFQTSKTPNKSKIYNLEERLKSFFIRVIVLCKKCPENAVTIRIIPQLVATGGSLPANWAEGTEAMSKKDFVKSIKICRKEAKESIVWLNGLKVAVDSTNLEFNALTQEAMELVYIFTSILKKTDIK